MTTAFVLHGRNRVEVGSDPVAIGSGAENDIVVTDARVSRAHAVIVPTGERFELRDLGSEHGTTVNGERLNAEARTLASGDSIGIGDQILRFVAGAATSLGESTEQAVTQRVSLVGEGLTIGRDPSNDLVLEDPNVSRFHAEISLTGDAPVVSDLGSRNGTRVNGRLLERPTTLADGAEVGVGRYRLVIEGTTVVARSEREALRLAASGVSVRVGERTILQPTEFELGPGELVALIGESGSGKSTLLKLLAGVGDPATGAVTLSGDPIRTRLPDVGYLPQDEIVHPLLTVREAVEYAGRLRLPRDTTPDELAQAVDLVLEELGLTAHAETRLARVSGGQRKRTGVAIELLGQPGVLLLDEPTTGMDPHLETQMMQLFRRVADRGRGVALVTHATRSLALCDRVVVMGRGGKCVFSGTPDDALEFFGANGFDEIYERLADRPPEEWSSPDPIAEPDSEPAAVPAAPTPQAVTRASSFAQARVLTGRYLKLMLRDRKNLLLLVGQAPILGLAGVGLFRSGVMDRSGEAVQLLYLAALVATWLGALAASRELVKDRAVFLREAAVGVRLRAYISSKLAVLLVLAIVQMVLYAGVLFALRPLDGPAEDYVEVIGLLIATCLTGAAMGLLISALAGTEDQATTIVPLAVIPQLLFAGATVPVSRMAEPAHSLAYLVFDRWSLASMGGAVDMNERIAADRSEGRAAQYGSDFFDISAVAGFGALAVFTLVFLAGTVFALHRQRQTLG